MLETLLRRFARFVTNRVVARPAAWKILRPLFRRQWDHLAATWEQSRRPDSFDPIKAGLNLLPSPPTRALDVGTGTGGAAFTIASRFSEANVVGVDLSSEMVDRARSKVTGTFARRISFQQADASSLPFPPEHFDLVNHSNMIPFFDETARVLRAGGHAIYAFSSGTETPIYVPLIVLRASCRNTGSPSSCDVQPAAAWPLLPGSRDLNLTRLRGWMGRLAGRPLICQPRCLSDGHERGRRRFSCR